MNTIKITHAVPLPGSILLVVIENQTNSKSDAILLTMPCEDALLSGYIESLEKTLSWPDDIQSGEDSEDVTFRIDEELYDRVRKWCAEVGISIEQLALAFIRF